MESVEYRRATVESAIRECCGVFRAYNLNFAEMVAVVKSLDAGIKIASLADSEYNAERGSSAPDAS